MTFFPFVFMFAFIKLWTFFLNGVVLRLNKVLNPDPTPKNQAVRSCLDVGNEGCLHSLNSFLKYVTTLGIFLNFTCCY